MPHDQHGLADGFQSPTDAMFSSFMSMAMMCMGITSEAPENYDDNAYDGPRENGLPHGSNGTVPYPDGREYSGDWRFGKRHGYGTIKRPDFAVVSAPWNDDKINGIAVIHVLAEGMEQWEQRMPFVNGKPHGEGIIKDGCFEYKAFWHVDGDGNLCMSTSDHGLKLDYIFGVDGTIAVTGEDCTEEPYARLCSHEIDKSVEICYTIKKTEVFFDGRAFGGVSSA